MNKPLLDLANSLTFAHIKAGTVPADEVDQALELTYTLLQSLSAAGAWLPIQSAPGGLSARNKEILRVVTTCLECGTKYKPVTEKHVRSHGLDGRAYRAKWAIDPSVSFHR